MRSRGCRLRGGYRMHGAFKQGGGDGLDGAALKGGLAREFGFHFGSDIERDRHRRLVRQKEVFFLTLRHGRG
jgi:hypothetical protein